MHFGPQNQNSAGHLNKPMGKSLLCSPAPKSIFLVVFWLLTTGSFSWAQDSCVVLSKSMFSGKQQIQLASLDGKRVHTFGNTGKPYTVYNPTNKYHTPFAKPKTQQNLRKGRGRRSLFSCFFCMMYSPNHRPIFRHIQPIHHCARHQTKVLKHHQQGDL